MFNLLLLPLSFLLSLFLRLIIFQPRRPSSLEVFHHQTSPCRSFLSLPVAALAILSIGIITIISNLILLFLLCDLGTNCSFSIIMVIIFSPPQDSRIIRVLRSPIIFPFRLWVLVPKNVGLVRIHRSSLLCLVTIVPFLNTTQSEQQAVFLGKLEKKRIVLKTGLWPADSEDENNIATRVAWIHLLKAINRLAANEENWSQ